MCDRIIVLREGAVTAQFAREEATQEKVIRAATGAAVAESPAKIAPLRPAEPKQAPVKVESQRVNPLRRLLAQRELGLVAAIAAVVFPIMLINPRMLSAANLSALSMDAALLVIVAIAQMLVVITRNIDLSVASVIGLAAYAAASTLHAHPEIGVGGSNPAFVRRRADLRPHQWSHCHKGPCPSDRGDAWYHVGLPRCQ